MSSPAGTDYSGDKPKRKSAKGRQLKRWDAGEDQLLLLYVDHVCVTNGIAIPWDDVAIAMEPRNAASGGIPMTGEAIKQHLAKVRAARESAEMTVPPKLDRAARRRAANCMKTGVPMTPSSIRVTANSVVNETPKPRSSLLPPPTKKEETKQKRAAQRATPKTKAPKKPAKRGRGRPVKKQIDEDDDDEDDYLATPATAGFGDAKKLRVLEHKDYTLPGTGEDEDDEEEEKTALLASGDGIYDAQGGSDYDEPVAKKTKTEKKSVRGKAGRKLAEVLTKPEALAKFFSGTIKGEANMFQAPVAPMSTPMTPAEVLSTNKPYSSKIRGRGDSVGPFDYHSQLPGLARQDNVQPGYGGDDVIPQSNPFVNNSGYSNNLNFDDNSGIHLSDVSSAMPYGGYPWLLNTNAFDGLPTSHQAAGSNDMPQGSTQYMGNTVSSTPTLASAGSFNSISNDILPSWDGFSDVSVPRPENSQGPNTGLGDQVLFDEMAEYLNFGDDADADFEVVDSKPTVY